MVPARLESRRLPEKVLADLGGRTMLEHVWRRVCAISAFDRVLIATDHPRIARAAAGFGGDVVLTGPAPSGTHRVAMAVGERPIQVINVQADQPLLEPSHLEVLLDRLDQGAAVATLCAGLEGDPGDPSRVKVECEGGRALRFSRSAVPVGGPYRVHIGIYGFGPGWVSRCASAPTSAGARAQDLEQIAWLEAGIAIHVDEVERAPRSVDTPEDLEEVARLLGAL